MRRAHPGDKMSIYKCRRAPAHEVDRWHYGHLADLIKQGVADRDTVYSGHYGPLTDRTDKKDATTMPSIAEIAHIKQPSQSRPAPEPTAPALVQAQFAYSALAEHVKNPLNGFERYNKDGIDGWIGPLALKPFIEDLIPPKAGWNSHQKHSRTRAVSEMLNRHKVAICIDHSGKLQGVKPTYFVAADGSVLDRLIPGKIIDPPAESSTPVKDQIKKSSRSQKSGGAYTRGYKILHKSVTKILKNAYNNHQIAVLGHELYELADFSGIEKTGREKPSLGGFYTWMRDRASRGEFSYRMETDDEFNARPNTQGGRKTYYYAPAGVEVPSMTHGETLAIYMAEAFSHPVETPPATSPETEAMAAEIVREALNFPVSPVPAPALSTDSDPRAKIIRNLTESIQTMNDFGLADHAGMDSAIHHLAQALAALTNG